MLEHPRVKPHLSVEIANPEQVFLLDETHAFVLEGRAYARVLPLVDGERTTADIIGELSDSLSMQELFAALAILERRGFITEDPATGAAAAYWSRLDVSPSSVAARFADTRLVLGTAGDADVLPMLSALQPLGLDIVFAEPDLTHREASGTPVVLVTDDYLEPTIAAVNDESLASARPWMIVRLAGTMPWIGPIFRPGVTACWECLRATLARNRHVEAFVEEHAEAGAVRTVQAALPASVGVAANVAATELARWLARATPPREGSLLTLDLLTLELGEHAVRRDPHCPSCGPPDARALQVPARIALTSQPKRFVSDGGHRVKSPQETWARVAPLVSPITGVATSLLRKDEQDNGVTFSYATGHAFPIFGKDLAALQQNMRFRSGGKGMSDLQARVSGVSEAIERFSGVWRDTDYAVRSSYRALGGSAVHPHHVMLFSDTQYATRHDWNARCSPTRYHVVPEPFDDEREIDWVPLTSLTDGGTRYLPAAFCYYGHREARQFFCGADANGTAAGNTIEEAILQGLFELVERDAVAVWWYNRLVRPAVDLDSVEIPYVAALRSHYATLGRELWVLDLTHDLGVPVFAAVSRRIAAPAEDIIVSFGAHFDPVIALTRALTETNQFLPALSRSGPDGATDYMYGDPDAIEWWRNATVANQPYVGPDVAASPRRLANFASAASDDVKTDIEHLVARLATEGIEVLVLDQTRRDIDFPTVRVVAPGLRHFWRRLAPGRLYDVPVSLGWQRTRLMEAELNPYSMFF